MSNFDDGKFDNFLKKNLGELKQPQGEWLKIQATMVEEDRKEFLWFKKRIYVATVAASIIFSVLTFNISFETKDDLSQLVETSSEEAGISDFMFED